MDLRINLADGRTEAYDLDKPEDLKRWRETERDRSRQGDVRGAIVKVSSGSTNVPRPSHFRDVAFSAEVCRDRAGGAVADRLTVQADDVRLDVLLYPRGVVRIDLTRTGRPRMLAQFERREGDQ